MVRRSIVVGLIATALLAGCARPGDPPTLDRFKPLLRLAVSVAVDRLLTQQPELAPMTLQVATVLVDVFDAGDFTTIDQVGAFIRARIPWDTIDPKARMLVEVLIDSIGEELRLLAMQHDIPQTQLVVVIKDILGWVAEVAQRHVTVPVRVRRVKQ